MSRLQTKCVLASAGMHLLLLLVLFVGPAFRSPENTPKNLPIIHFVPLATVDAAVSGGGYRKAHPPPSPPAVRPQPPAPRPAQVKVPAPKPKPKLKPKKVIKKTKPAPKQRHVERRVERRRETREVRRPKPRHRIVVNKRLITRHSAEREAARRRAEAARAREIARAHNEALHAIDRTVAGIQHHLSGTTTIKLNGPGGGGIPYANWLQAVKSDYANAWVVPDSITDDSLTATAVVTIAGDGHVLAAHLVGSSGNGLVDESVRATLQRVRHTAPLPDNAKEAQRTVTIHFNVKSKLFG